jgi:hypothetical protein
VPAIDIIMQAGDFNFIILQDTSRVILKTNPVKTGTPVSLEPVIMPSLLQEQPLQETDVLTRRQEITNHKTPFIFRKKSIENPDLVNDSTLHLKPQPDFFIQQISVKPKGLMLPSIPHWNHSPDWFVYLFLGTFVIFVFVKQSAKKYFSLLFQSITSYLASARMFREQNISLVQGSAVMELFYLLVMALFGYQVLHQFGISFPFPDFFEFLICFGVLFLFFQVKIMIYKLLGFVSGTNTETREYLFNIQNHNKVLGILLWPLVALIAWLPFRNSWIFILTGLLLTAIIYLIYLFRGAKIIIKKQYSMFYLFLYLCTLEILPLLLLFKFIQTR